MTEVRNLEAAEIDEWLRQKGAGFHFQIHDGLGEYTLGTIELDRTWGAFDNDAVVGTLRSFRTDLTVPGPATVAAAALTNVTVATSHRRKGILTDMITRDLRAA